MITLTIITTVIAVCGFVLACISLGWQIWKHFAKRKENIKGKLSITVATLPGGKNVPAIGLRIWNNGEVPVYIKSIFLNWGEEHHRLGPTVTGLQFKGNPPTANPLRPGDARDYILPAIPCPMFAVASNQPKDKLWVSVRSQKKEVLRLQGDDLKDYLSKMVEVTDKNEITEVWGEKGAK